MDAVKYLKNLLKRAQPAPWEVISVPHPYERTWYELYAADTDVARFHHADTAEFCEAARNLLPEVLAELESLRAELAALKEVARG